MTARELIDLVKSMTPEERVEWVELIMNTPLIVSLVPDMPGKITIRDVDGRLWSLTFGLPD